MTLRVRPLVRYRRYRGGTLAVQDSAGARGDGSACGVWCAVGEQHTPQVIEIDSAAYVPLHPITWDL
jgi:hypothetical protein